MARLTQRKVKFIGIAIVLLVLLLLSVAAFYFYAFLSRFISVPGAIGLFTVSLILFMKTVIQLAVFPGSFRLWRRNLESHFCREMSAQLSNRIADLRMAVEILLEGSLERERTDFLARSVVATSHSKRLLEQLLETFEQLKGEGSLRGRQLQLYELLLEFKQALLATRLTLASQSEISLWDWLDAELDESDYSNVIFSDYPHNEFGLKAHLICERLELFLLESFGPVSCFKRVKRWLYDNTLGNIDQMRIELKRKFKTEGFWVPAEDGKTMDCLWFWTDDPKSDTPAVLLCNPNAGFYEFAYYQSEWLEFYLNNGVNVCMWNYRGYGRSGGWPSVKKLQRDAVAVLKHLKDIRGVSRLGAHGESMGGAVVSYIAAQCRLEFVYADRTFWSLDKTAYYNFGLPAQLLLRLFSGKSQDSAENFLTASCPKFLSSDPSDTMINDLSSLKAGVAEGLTGSARLFRILPESSLNNLAESYTRLMRLIHEFERSPRSSKLLSVLHSTPDASQNISQYQLLSKDSDALDDEALTTFLFRVANSVYSLDAGGKPLKMLHYSHKPKQIKQALKSWILVLEVWGSYLNVTSDNLSHTRSLAAERIRKSGDDLAKLVAEYEPLMTSSLITESCNDTTVLSSCFLKIAYYLEDHLPKPGDASSSTVDSLSRVAIDYGRAGHLVPLTCGHSGPYNIPERMMYEAQLIQIGFFSS